MTAAEGFCGIDDHRLIFASDGHGKSSVEQFFMTAAEGFCGIDDHRLIFASDGHEKPSVEQHLMTTAQGFGGICDQWKSNFTDGHKNKQPCKSTLVKQVDTTYDQGRERCYYIRIAIIFGMPLYSMCASSTYM